MIWQNSGDEFDMILLTNENKQYLTDGIYSNYSSDSDSKVLPVNLPNVINQEDFTYRDGIFMAKPRALEK